MSLQCRVCLFKVDIDSSTDLFSETSTGELISEVLTSFVPVYIVKGDGLPDRICLNCEKKLMDVLDFRSLLISSNSELQKLTVTESFSEENLTQNIELIEDCIKVEPEIIQEVNCANTLKFVCDTCGKTFPNRNYLEKHLTVHDPERPFMCYDCDRGFKYKSSFKQHKKLIHSETGYRCSKCCELIQTYASFKNHVLLHNESTSSRSRHSKGITGKKLCRSTRRKKSVSSMRILHKAVANAIAMADKKPA